jgi:hypothetical protein
MSENIKTSVPFYPVKCTQEKLNDIIQKRDGFLYFTTDTHKVYLDHEGQRLEI